MEHATGAATGNRQGKGQEGPYEEQSTRGKVVTEAPKAWKSGHGPLRVRDSPL